jgi:fatty-acyl-CoA synthase
MQDDLPRTPPTTSPSRRSSSWSAPPASSRITPPSSTARSAAPIANSADRCVQLAHALTQRGLGKGDVVAVLLPNTPAMLEAITASPWPAAS